MAVTLVLPKTWLPSFVSSLQSSTRKDNNIQGASSRNVFLLMSNGGLGIHPTEQLLQAWF